MSPGPPDGILLSVPDAPWLPPGGRAEVVRSPTAPRPTGLVRLLVRRDGTVFCTPRDDGRLDLPTRRVSGDDPDGSVTARRLVRDVLGPGARPSPVGYVRNVVPAPDDDYPWPVPVAHFTVWEAVGEPVRDGRWVDVSVGSSVLGTRHWWPLVAGAPGR